LAGVQVCVVPGAEIDLTAEGFLLADCLGDGRFETLPADDVLGTLGTDGGPPFSKRGHNGVAAVANPLGKGLRCNRVLLDAVNGRTYGIR